jgi:hypothetical protein
MVEKIATFRPSVFGINFNGRSVEEGSSWSHSTSDDKVTMLSRNVMTDYLLMRRYILEGKNSKCRFL